MATALQHLSALAQNQLDIFHHYLSGENEAGCYHTQFSYHLQVRDLSLPLFHKAVRTVLDRHPVLKTVFFRDPGGAICQGINPKLPVEVAFEDLSQLISWQQEEWLEEFLRQDRSRPFSVWDQGQPLWRVSILRRGPGNLQLVLSFHHAIWDGWSLAVLLKEIFAHYQALKAKPTLRLAPAPYEYSQFLAAEAAESGGEQARAFWRRHLQHHRPYMPLPLAPPAAGAAYRPGLRLLAPELSASLVQVQRQLRVTLKSIFIGLFLWMVQDETRQRQVTIGVVTNGRGMQLQNPLGTLGLLWNLAPLCLEINPRHPGFFRHVNSTLSELAPHSRYPLSAIAADQGDAGLFHAAFNFINFEGARLLEEGADVEFLEVGGLDKFHYPLHLLVGKNPFTKEFSLVLNYDTRYYQASQVEEMLDQYVNRLNQLANTVSVQAESLLN
ncbi:MAG: condensation domain-containing protein [Adhaeribacter sp.]